jgi:hypothetical protein
MSSGTEHPDVAQAAASGQHGQHYLCVTLDPSSR